MANKEVKNGSTVKIHYTGNSEDGKIFDEMQGQNTLQFKVGNKEVIKGLDRQIIGMKQGEKKTININPDEAYGDRNEQLIRKIPRSGFPPNFEFKKGMTLLLKSPEGRYLQLRVLDFDDKEVTADLNHPLAGKKLLFDIEIVETS